MSPAFSHCGPWTPRGCGQRTFRGPQTIFIILLKHRLCIMSASALIVGKTTSDPAWIRAVAPGCPGGHCILYHHTCRGKCQFHLSMSLIKQQKLFILLNRDLWTQDFKISYVKKWAVRTKHFWAFQSTMNVSRIRTWVIVWTQLN